MFRLHLSHLQAVTLEGLKMTQVESKYVSLLM
jgi:hypothetical protein